MRILGAFLFCSLEDSINPEKKRGRLPSFPVAMKSLGFSLVEAPSPQGCWRRMHSGFQMLLCRCASARIPQPPGSSSSWSGSKCQCSFRWKGIKQKKWSRWVVCQLNLWDCLISCWNELSGTETGFQDAGVRFPFARGGVPHLDILVRRDLRLVSEFTRLYWSARKRPCVVSINMKVSLHRHPLSKPRNKGLPLKREMGKGAQGVEKSGPWGAGKECVDHPASDSGKCIKHKRVATFPPPPRVPGMKDNIPPASRFRDLQRGRSISVIRLLFGGKFW